MSFDRSKLRGRIAEKYSNMSGFADKMGCSRANIYSAMKEGHTFRLSLANRWAEALDIQEDEIPVFFYTPKSHKSENG